MVLGPGKDLSFTLSLNLFSYHFQSVKSRCDTVQGLCLEHLCQPLFLDIFFSHHFPEIVWDNKLCHGGLLSTRVCSAKVLQLCFILVWGFFILKKTPKNPTNQTKQTNKKSQNNYIPKTLIFALYRFARKVSTFG